MEQTTQPNVQRMRARDDVIAEFVRRLLRDGAKFDPGFKELWMRQQVGDFVDSFAAQVERRL